ncbi:MobQ family relaxase [Crocosphaera sp. Alani8]|uniref:MobQ family relaxase n=2 Tax=unclassified Crocosphaera TaxID=2623705 RepID=UPI00313C500C
MAIYHLSAKIISRGKGQSATASAAYRAAEKIRDERTGLIFDYRRKGEVYATEIIAPDNAPDWVNSRETLWNQVELFERRKNSQLAREFDMALPLELTHHQKQELVRKFVKAEFISRGLAADLAFHNFDSHNPHVHIMVTTRTVDDQGFGAKTRHLNKKDFLLSLRKSWETHTNEALEQAGSEQRIDHRSLEQQGINRIPQIHLGANVMAMMKRGIVTERGEQYLSIQATNSELETLEQQLVELEQVISSQEQSKPNSRLRQSPIKEETDSESDKLDESDTQVSFSSKDLNLIDSLPLSPEFRPEYLFQQQEYAAKVAPMVAAWLRVNQISSYQDTQNKIDLSNGLLTIRDVEGNYKMIVQYQGLDEQNNAIWDYVYLPLNSPGLTMQDVKLFTSPAMKQFIKEKTTMMIQSNTQQSNQRRGRRR